MEFLTIDLPRFLTRCSKLYYNQNKYKIKSSMIKFCVFYTG